MAHTGYTTNLPLADVTGGKAWVVWDVDGEPLTREHGGPARLLVPHLYFWKSAKWVSGLRLLDHDEPGFWERNGYHDRGDPWPSSATRATEPVEHAPEGTTHRRTLRWQSARVVDVRAETPRARTLRLALPAPRRHVAGQHYVVRLTAPDGYTASRSYSVASAPDDTRRDRADRRGAGGRGGVGLPARGRRARRRAGGPRPDRRLLRVAGRHGPALLVGGGSGVVPLVSMLRQARREGRADLLRLVVSARSPEDLYYADELPGPETTVVYTRPLPPARGRPGGWWPPTSRRGARRGGRVRLRLPRLLRRGDRPARGARGPGRVPPPGALRPSG